jgi:hypothetical protein
MRSRGNASQGEDRPGRLARADDGDMDLEYPFHVSTKHENALSKHSLASQRMFAESLLSEQDFCPKTGGHFSEILL